MEKGIFDGLKVLDCASFIAAPAAATVLSDFGADVIKIEPPGTGDPYRNLPNLPGYPASHGCLRLLADDAAWIYGWADQWTLSTDRSRVEDYGTPVIVFGKYDYGKQAPWKLLVTDYRAASLTGSELEEAIRLDLLTSSAQAAP